MEIVAATEGHALAQIDQIPELVYSTGPASYSYQFGSRGVLDPLIRASWMLPETLFSYDATTLALEGDELLGLEIGFTNPGFHERSQALAPIWPALDEFTEANKEHLAGLGRRIFECSWLNPVIPEDVYYVHALAVTEGHRGEGIGAALLRNAIDHAQEIELKGLQLDVLSGNPAVDFYRSFGLEVLVESTVPSAFAKGVPTELRMGMRF